MTPQEKLPAAEKLYADLLAELTGIDADLRRLPQSDPRREELKARKANVLPRYRGAKEHVAELRRQANGSKPGAGAPRPTGAPERLADVLRSTEILRKLYGALTGALERSALDNLTDEEIEATTAFLDWWEGSA